MVDITRRVGSHAPRKEQTDRTCVMDGAHLDGAHLDVDRIGSRQAQRPARVGRTRIFENLGNVGTRDTGHGLAGLAIDDDFDPGHVAIVERSRPALEIQFSVLPARDVDPTPGAATQSGDETEVRMTIGGEQVEVLLVGQCAR